MDQLDFVEVVDGLSERVVIAVAYAAYRGFDAGFRQALGVFDRNILAAAVAVLDEPAAMGWPALIQSLFKSIEDERGMGGAADPPADDVSGKDVDDESHIDEALPGGDIG